MKQDNNVSEVHKEMPLHYALMNVTFISVLLQPK